MGSAEDLTIEQYFILDVLCGLAKNSSPVSFYRNIFDNLNWPRIIKISSRQKVLGFIAYAAREQGWRSFLSSDIQEILENALLEYRFLNEEKKMQFKRICVLLEDEGVSVSPLKGVYLSSFIYEDMPYRSMDDIDILISPQQVDKVIKILEKEGFTQAIYPLRYRWHTQIIQEVFINDGSYWKRLGRSSYTDGNGLNIDIHWEPYYVIGGERITFPSDFLLKSAHPEFQHLLFLSAHAADQYTPSLVQIFDIALSMCKIPSALSCLEEEVEDWPLLAKEHLLRLCGNAHDIFLSETPIPNLSDEALKLLKAFFKMDGKKERYDPYSPILSIQQKIRFRLGYFIPEPSYYQENNPLVMYQRHWSFLIEKFTGVPLNSDL